MITAENVCFCSGISYSGNISGLKSTRPTWVVRQGKLEPRSESPAKCSGYPANLIANTLFNLDIEQIKKILIS